MQKPQCRAITVGLSAALKGPDTPHDKDTIDAAIQHIHACPDCRRSAGELIQAMMGLTCAEYQDRLPELLLAQQSGQPDSQESRMVMLHVQACTECSAIYNDLVDLMALANRERGVEPPAYPAPQLQFLRPTAAEAPHPAPRPWRLDQLGRVIIEISTEILQAFQPPQRPIYAGALKAAEATPTLWQLALTDLDDLAVTVTAQAARNAPVDCTVVVEAIIPSRGGWPQLAGTQVTLQLPKGESTTRLTDAFGNAVFGDIPVADLSQLVVTIQKGELV